MTDLKQIKEEDFELYNNQYILKKSKNAEYVTLFVTTLLEYKNEIFKFVQNYYRHFMKQSPISEYYRIDKDDIS